MAAAFRHRKTAVRPHIACEQRREYGSEFNFAGAAKIRKMLRKNLCLFAVAALVQGCAEKPSTASSGNYRTMVVATADRTLTQEFHATLSGRQVVEVRPQVSGLITEIRVDEGQRVRRGQTLFVIDQTIYRAAADEANAAVASAEAALATARLNLESTEALHEKGVVKDFTLATARNDLASAEAALSQAKAQQTDALHNLSYTEIRSPTDGRISMINYRIGALVSSSISDPLVTIADDGVMQAYFSISEGQMLDLMQQFGSAEKFVAEMPDVSLRLSNGSAYAASGRISAVSGLVTQSTGAVIVRADFPNADGLLRSGGSATVIVPSVRHDCIVIPQSATFELQNRIFAYKVVDGRAQSTPIEVFRLNDGREYIVESGLAAGDVVIAEGAGLVREGAVVNVSPKND